MINRSSYVIGFAVGALISSLWPLYIMYLEIVGEGCHPEWETVCGTGFFLDINKLRMLEIPVFWLYKVLPIPADVTTSTYILFIGLPMILYHAIIGGILGMLLVKIISARRKVLVQNKPQ